MKRTLSFERTSSLSRQLSQRILLLSAIAILGLLALVGVGLLAAFQSTQTELILARDAATGSFTRFLGGIIDDLNATSDILDMRPDIDETFRRTLQRQTAIFELNYINPAGRILNQRQRVGQGEGTFFAEQPWLETVQAGNAYIGEVDYSDFGVPFITIAVPVSGSTGEFKGTLLATTDLTALWRPITNLKIGETGYVYIADQTGKLLAFRDLELVQTNVAIESITGRTPQEITQSESNVHNGLGGSLTIASGQALEIVPWFVIVEQPINEALRTFIWLAAGLLILLVFVSFQAANVFQFAQRRIIEPLSHLQAGAKELESKGRLEQPIAVETQDELGDLAGTFNSMAAQLQDMIGNLEQRVTARTKDLATVAEVSTAASTILETDKLLQSVVELTKDRFNLYHSHIYLLDEAGENLVLAAGAGEPGRIMAAEKRSIPLDREQSLVARAAREQKGVTVNDVTAEPGFLANPLLPNTRSELAVPMLVGPNLIGVFDIQAEEVGRFADADIDIQTALAAQIASAVQNTRLYNQAEASKQEAQSLVDFASEGIAILDLETELWAEPNESFAKTFGMTRQEMATTGPKVMSPPKQPDGRDSVEKAIEMINTAMEKGSHRFEWVHLTANGKEFDCEIGLVRMPGEHPRLRQSLVDITERKQLQELTRRRAEYQETLNTITQKIQGAATVEAALQVTARELGHALGKKQTLVSLEASNTPGKEKGTK